MATIKPFPALRPPANRVAEVASPPYDVVSTDEARALIRGRPDSFLHVSRPEVDLPPGTDEHSDPVYEKAAQNLQALVERGALVRDAQPHFYGYAQTMGDHRQVGLVACASVQEYLDGSIKKHEKTRPDKEDDRTRHIGALNAHDEPVFLTYRARGEIDEQISKITSARATYDFTSDDGVRHELWVVDVDAGPALQESFASVPALYVADGHHRSAAAARVHQERGGEGGEHDVFLCVIFPHDQMQILAYNRIVRDPQGRTAEVLLESFREKFDVVEGPPPVPEVARTFGVYLGGTWYRLLVRDGTFDPGDPVASLDASICQDQILAPMFGIEDPTTDENVGFVGGIRGAVELEKRVAEGWSLGLFLYPTSVEQLLAVSDAGLLMPPKSTWFEPKLRSGLFVHTF